MKAAGSSGPSSLGHLLCIRAYCLDVLLERWHSTSVTIEISMTGDQQRHLDRTQHQLHVELVSFSAERAHQCLSVDGLFVGACCCGAQGCI